MVYIKIADLDKDEFLFLQNSDFFNNLDSTEKDEEINIQYICPNNTKDIISFLEVIRFWGLLKIPDEFFELFLYTSKLCITNNTLEIISFLKNLVENTHFKFFELLYEISKNPISELINLIIKYNNLEFLKFIHINKYKWYKNSYSSKCFYRNNYLRDENTCRIAAKYNSLECLKYLRQNNCLWDICTCTIAAENGNLEILKYVHENGCPWDENTIYGAAKNGQFECLKYAHENGCIWDKFAGEFAAKNGHLSCLIYLQEKGYKLEGYFNKTMLLSFNNTKCIKYLSENGIKIYNEHFILLIKNKRLDILKILKFPKNDENFLNNAVMYKSLESIKILHLHRCLWTEKTLEICVENGSLEILEYLIKNNCPCNLEICNTAAKNGHLDCLKYLHQNGFKCWPKTILLAEKNGHIECSNYAKNNL